MITKENILWGKSEKVLSVYSKEALRIVSFLRLDIVINLKQALSTI